MSIKQPLTFIFKTVQLTEWLHRERAFTVTFAQNMNEFMNYRSNAFKHNTGWPDELQIEIPADYAAQFVDSCNLADLQVNIIKPSQMIKTTTVCLLATQAASTF